MDKEQVKKLVSESYARANILIISKAGISYISDLPQGRVSFNVPIEEMGEDRFYGTMAASRLVRWIVQFEENETKSHEVHEDQPPG